MSYMEYAESALGGETVPEGSAENTAEPLRRGERQGDPSPAADDGTEPTTETLGSDSDATGGTAEQGDNGSPEALEGTPTPGRAGKNDEVIQEEEALPVEKPKRKRTVRKKAAPSTEDAEGEEAAKKEPASGNATDGEGTVQAAEGSEDGGELLDADTAAFVLEEGQTDGESGPQDGQAETSSGENTDPTTPASTKSAASSTRRPQRTALTKKAEPKEQFSRRPLSSRPSLLSLDLNKLDEGLTEEEREEWNAIYASYRSKSILTGQITGIDSHSFSVRSRETGRIERRRMLCAVIISYRAKVLIPETEMWLPGQEKPSHVLRNMSGAEIDYTILDVDREGGVAIGSRRMAVLAQRHFFDAAKGGRKLGERLTCRVLSVGPKRCLVECGGRDMNLTQKDLTYTATPDLRKRYHPGQTLNCILKDYNRQTGQLWVSVKETTDNPFFGAIKRHPVGSRRQAVISGKYAGGVFCTLPDETVCLCLYSTRHSDSDFHIGDTVILAIKKFDYDRQLIYGIILSKW